MVVLKNPQNLYCSQKIDFLHACRLLEIFQGIVAGVAEDLVAVADHGVVTMEGDMAMVGGAVVSRWPRC